MQDCIITCIITSLTDVIVNLISMLKLIKGKLSLDFRESCKFTLLFQNKKKQIASFAWLRLSTAVADSKQNKLHGQPLSITLLHPNDSNLLGRIPTN